MKQATLNNTTILFLNEQIKIQNDENRHFQSLLPELPLVYAPIHDDETAFTLPGQHVKLTAVTFVDVTDRNDFLVREYTEPVYQSRYYPQTRRGNVFIIDSYLTGEALLIISEAAPYAEVTLTVSRGKAYLHGCGYGAAYGYCRTADAKPLVRRYYRHGYAGDGSTYILSNTWGGQIKKELLCEDFMIKEIDKAARLGVDIVQIDADWEIGDIFEAIIYGEDGKATPFKRIEGDFWSLNEEKFPHGLRYLSDYAARRGITLGIWFAPDCRDGMKNRERDLAVIRHLYHDCGIRYFKLDMVSLETPETEANYLGFLAKIYEMGDDIHVNLDITDGNRTGYFLAKEYGTLFVENRYTNAANYYPHNTLKNLWMLSPYIPADKFQFEIMDCRKNADCYPEDDPLAPSLYDIDYLFASVMLANPLLWMNMQALSDEDSERLRRIITVYKEHRTALFGLDITPIGTRPDGASFTGFLVGKEYLLLFRERTPERRHVYDIPLAGEYNITMLSSNADASLSLADGRLTAELSAPRAYVFAKIDPKA